MSKKPLQDTKSLRRELAMVKAELYNLQTARSVRSAQFVKQLLKSRRPADFVSHARLAPSLLRRAEAPLIEGVDMYEFLNSVQSPAPLFMYANLNVALLGEYAKGFLVQTTNCVPFGGSEYKILEKFDSVQLVAIDYEEYGNSHYEPLLVSYKKSKVMKVLVFANLDKHNKKSILSKFKNIKIEIIDTSSKNLDLKYINIYSLNSPLIEPAGATVKEINKKLPTIADTPKNSILLVDYNTISDGEDADTKILNLVANGIPVVFMGKKPKILKDSPFLSVKSSDEIRYLTEDIYAADKYLATIRRYVIANFNAIRPTNYILKKYLSHIKLKDPLDVRISVLLSTRRPEFVDYALKNLEKQTTKPHEVLLMLHGATDKDYKEASKRAAKSPLDVIVTKHSKDQLFGQVLDDGLQRATGDYISKIDDDDHYGENHLYDLCVARVHSQADIVGKWNNWIHVTKTNEVISWVPEKENGYYGHLPGGTILAKAPLMKSLGFGYVRHGIDSELYERAKRRGVSIYSTHRYNYVRVRHNDHTYTAKDSDFMSRAHAVKFKNLDFDNLFC